MKGLSNLLFVFIGGGTGAILRYGFSLFIKISPSGFPLATFWVNVIGCFFIGLLYSFLNIENQALRLLLIVGLLGGFTTFSSFGNETMQLIEKGRHQTAFFYVILSNICGLAAVYLGTKISSIVL
jgi:CrcB protein